MAKRKRAPPATGMKVAGLSSRTLKYLFTGALSSALMFTLLSFVYTVGPIGHWLRASTLNVVVLLLLIDLPLWCAQIALWGRGEGWFEAYLPKMNRTLETLEKIAFLIDYAGPSIAAMQDFRAKSTPEEYELVCASMYGTTNAAIAKSLERISQADPEMIERWLTQWRNRGAGPPPG